MTVNFWKEIDVKQTELEGPYECPACGGHIMLDATYLDQYETMVVCPYCESRNYVQSIL